MELMTSRFGTVSFQTDEVLRFERGLRKYHNLRHWLLLADSSHPSLFWLQSIAQPQIALPVVFLSQLQVQPVVTVSQTILEGLRGCEDGSIIGLSPLVYTDDGIDVLHDQPIIISPHSRRGTQLAIDRDNPAQLVPSEQVAPLRQTA